MHVDGGCHCGAIAFTAQLDPDKVVICHCRDCQIMSGGPYRSVAQVAEASFNLVRGTGHIYQNRRQR